jgi:type IV pilus assembly protein PilE
MNNRGFTLIELMVVVVIIGVLASFALPSYYKYSMRSIRSEGQSFILQILAEQERYYNERARYASVLGPTGLGMDSDKPQTDGEHYYAQAKACPNTTINQCVQVYLEPVSQVAKDLEAYMKKKVSVTDAKIWSQSNQQKSKSWDQAIN